MSNRDTPNTFTPVTPLLQERLLDGVDLIIWDFDGTILDTEWPTFVAAKAEFERYGKEIDIAVWQDTLGSADHEPWWEGLRRQVGGFDESDEDLLARFRTFKRELTDANDLRPGVQALFDRFAAESRPCAVGSSSPLHWVEGHLKRHELWEQLVTVVTSDDVGTSRTKPHPDIFLLAAERANTDPARCLVFEDSHHGVTAAKTAGMRVVATPHHLTETQDLTAADVVVQSLANF